MASSLAKFFIIIITLNTFCYLGLMADPHYHATAEKIGAESVFRLLNVNETWIERSENVNEPLANYSKSESGISAGNYIIPDYVSKAVDFVSFFVTFLTAPFILLNDLAGTGAPAAAVVTLGAIIVATYTATLMDWIRGGH